MSLITQLVISFLKRKRHACIKTHSNHIKLFLVIVERVKSISQHVKTENWIKCRKENERRQESPNNTLFCLLKSHSCLLSLQINIFSLFVGQKWNRKSFSVISCCQCKYVWVCVCRRRKAKLFLFVRLQYKFFFVRQKEFTEDQIIWVEFNSMSSNDFSLAELCKKLCRGRELHHQPSRAVFYSSDF